MDIHSGHKRPLILTLGLIGALWILNRFLRSPQIDQLEENTHKASRIIPDTLTPD